MVDQDDAYFPVSDAFPAGQGLEELDAIWRALVTGPLESASLALREIVVAGNVFRCRSFHAGILSGALLVLAGFAQLWQVAPTLVVDIVLAYMFYKLSALAAELKRKGRANNICARIQLVLLLILSFKDNSACQGIYGFLVDWIWTLNIYLYIITVYYEVIGIKHLRAYWLGIYRTLPTKGGLKKVVKFTILDMFFFFFEKSSICLEEMKRGTRMMKWTGTRLVCLLVAMFAAITYTIFVNGRY